MLGRSFLCVLGPDSLAEVASIGKNSGKKAELGATIKQVEKELGQNNAALDKATAVPCLLSAH